MEFYAREYGIRAFVHGVGPYRGLSGYVDDVNALRGRRRVWLLFSEVAQRDGINEEWFFLHVCPRPYWEPSSEPRCICTIWEETRKIMVRRPHAIRTLDDPNPRIQHARAGCQCLMLCGLL